MKTLANFRKIFGIIIGAALASTPYFGSLQYAKLTNLEKKELTVNQLHSKEKIYSFNSKKPKKSHSINIAPQQSLVVLSQAITAKANNNDNPPSEKDNNSNDIVFTLLIVFFSSSLLFAVTYLMVKGIVVIHDSEVGIVYKKFAPLKGSLSNGQYIARDKEAGYQPEILNPGWHFWHWKWMYEITRESVLNISPNEVGLITANDGISLPSNRNFGYPVDCDEFQNARAFLEKKGQKGMQLNILTSGAYRINSKQFTVQKQEITRVGNDEVALVVANDGKALPDGKIFATEVIECNEFQDAFAFIKNGGQMGKQLVTLGTGFYKINTNLFNIKKVHLVKVNAGEIALVIANEGAKRPPGRTLGKVVECDNFQNAELFLRNGGQKGRQLAVLTSGIYKVNTDFFSIVNTSNASLHGINPEKLKIFHIQASQVGIVTTTEGQTISTGEICGPSVTGHENFQDPQKFIDSGGYKGLQEEVLTGGSWTLNPWFVDVELVELTEIRNGYVGVIKSNVGKSPISDNEIPVDSISYLVDHGYKGILSNPLPPGKYPVNTVAQDVVEVPTSDLALRWSNKNANKYYINLPALKVLDKNGFVFDVEVTQFIKITPENAPKVICSFGSLDELVEDVLKPTVSYYFLNAAQGYEALEFQSSREYIQDDARKNIQAALTTHMVEVVDTVIGDIDLPPELMEPLRKEKIARQTIDQLETETAVEKKRQNFELEKEKAKLQANVARRKEQIALDDLEREQKRKQAEADLKIKRLASESELQTKRKQSEVNALAKKLMKEVDLDSQRQEAEIEAVLKERLLQLDIRTLKRTIEVLGSDTYSDLEKTKVIADALKELKVPIVPQTVFGNSSESNSIGMAVTQLLHQFGLSVSSQENIGFNSKIDSKTVLQEASKRLSLPETSQSVSRNIGNQEASIHHIPVIFVLDTSSSVSDSYIELLCDGMNFLKKELDNDSVASQCIEVGIVSFGDSARIIQDFSLSEKLSIPKIKKGGDALTGQGLELALDKLQELLKSYEVNDFLSLEPWMILISGSIPSDDWNNATLRLQHAVEENRLKFYAFGIDDIDISQLAQIVPQSITPVILNGTNFQELFDWCSESFKLVANSKHGGVDVGLPKI